MSESLLCVVPIMLSFVSGYTVLWNVGADALLFSARDFLINLSYSGVDISFLLLFS